MHGQTPRQRSNQKSVIVKLSFSPSDKPQAIPTNEGLEQKVAPIQAGSRTVDERFYHPTGAEYYYC